MLTVTHDYSGELAVLRPMWEEIRRELLRAKRVIDEEIRSYPTPIPRCDAQFNHLYEQQARLARELDRVGALDETIPGREDYIRLIEEFIASTPYTEDGAERELRSRLKAEFPTVGK